VSGAGTQGDDIFAQTAAPRPVAIVELRRDADGIHSNIFALAAFFAAIVMYDAAGVRLAVSRQARILNRMVDEFYEGKPHIEKHLIELIGHTRIEVLAGAIFGIILAFYWT
jgi:acid phosphatase family membrane protein YuiD